MIVSIHDDIIKDVDEYVADIHNGNFEDISDGDNVFKNIQIRDASDEFAKMVLFLFSDYNINFNFVRKSPLNQDEPNFIHSDEMMGDITCVLYLNKKAPKEDGTTIYNKDKSPKLRMYSMYNRMICFDSSVLHSRNIFNNFGMEDDSRLVQVIFLKKRNETGHQGNKA
jgi:hypothetical protein